MKEVSPFANLIRFEAFEVNLYTGELCKTGERIRLPEQSFQILSMLLKRPGQLVTREEIRKRLWPNNTIVEFENSINAAVKRLRIALGDSADQPRYVETLARRGYRWLVPIEGVEENRTSNDASTPAQAEPVPSSLTGKKVSHYRVLEILGGGGMGVVYKAEDLKLGRRVALKFLPDELTSDGAAMERFEREARAASALNHPNICTIHAVEEHADQPFIVMELLEGQTLRDLMSGSTTAEPNIGRFPISLETLLDIATQTAAGMEAAHKKGIIHRDIKPANIFITSLGQAKILDFGLAKLQESELPEAASSSVNGSHPVEAFNHALSRTGVAMGTAGYMSPEQVRGEKLDARTDLFSFGLVLYEMAAGQRAFSGDCIHCPERNSEPVADPGWRAEFKDPRQSSEHHWQVPPKRSSAPVPEHGGIIVRFKEDSRTNKANKFSSMVDIGCSNVRPSSCGRFLLGFASHDGSRIT
jgi:serine/threonine protein kinase